MSAAPQRAPARSPSRTEELALRLANALRVVLDGRPFRFELGRIRGESPVERLARVVLDGSAVLEVNAEGRVDLERRGPLQPQHGSLTIVWRQRHRIDEAPVWWFPPVLREAGAILDAARLHVETRDGQGPDVDAVLDAAERALEGVEGEG